MPRLSRGSRSLPHRSPRFGFRSDLDELQARGSHQANHVLSETRRAAGLTLIRVLRGGLQLGECLG